MTEWRASSKPSAVSSDIQMLQQWRHRRKSEKSLLIFLQVFEYSGLWLCFCVHMCEWHEWQMIVWVCVCVWVCVVYVLFSGFMPNWLRYKGSSNSDKKKKKQQSHGAQSDRRKSEERGKEKMVGKEEGREERKDTYLLQRDTQLAERGWQWQTSTESETEHKQSQTIETTPQHTHTHTPTHTHTNTHTHQHTHTPTHTHTYRCTTQILHTLSNSMLDTSSSAWILSFTWDNFSP